MGYCSATEFSGSFSSQKSLILFGSYSWNMLVGKDASQEAMAVIQLRDDGCLNQGVAIRTWRRDIFLTHKCGIMPNPMFVRRIKWERESTCKL